MRHLKIENENQTTNAPTIDECIGILVAADGNEQELLLYFKKDGNEQEYVYY
jgi:hypothetical protein